MVINKKELFKDKKLKITYITLPNEISGDEGIYYDSDDTFITICLNDSKLKWIPLNKIVRIQQI